MTLMLAFEDAYSITLYHFREVNQGFDNLKNLNGKLTKDSDPTEIMFGRKAGHPDSQVASNAGDKAS